MYIYQKPMSGKKLTRSGKTCRIVTQFFHSRFVGMRSQSLFRAGLPLVAHRGAKGIRRDWVRCDVEHFYDTAISYL